jgi:PKD repeat protein
MQITHARTNESLRRSRARRASLLGWLPVAAVIALSGCSVKKAETPDSIGPDPTGPSELGLSLQLRAEPDVLVMDGVSKSRLTITSRDSNGKPQPNVAVRVEVTAGGQIVDVIGRLSTKNPTTDGNGNAVVEYTAPNSPPNQGSDSGADGVTLIVTPAGNDYRSAFSRQVDIRLVPQGVILPIAYAPVPKFTLSPTPPSEETDVTFDASSSIPSCVPDPTAPNDTSKCQPQGGSIIAYQWDFGNGRTGSGVRATTRFSTRGTYVVKLTVTNDRGLSNSVSTQVTVAAVENPTADFVTSPTQALAGQTVFFNASPSKGAPGRTIDHYEWDFGDGNFGSGSLESHVYEKAGTYKVVLVVTDSGGRTGTVSKDVSIGTATGTTTPR